MSKVNLFCGLTQSLFSSNQNTELDDRKAPAKSRCHHRDTLSPPFTSEDLNRSINRFKIALAIGINEGFRGTLECKEGAGTPPLEMEPLKHSSGNRRKFISLSFNHRAHVHLYEGRDYKNYYALIYPPDGNLRWEKLPTQDASELIGSIVRKDSYTPEALQLLQLEAMQISNEDLAMLLRKSLSKLPSTKLGRNFPNKTTEALDIITGTFTERYDSLIASVLKLGKEGAQLYFESVYKEDISHSGMKTSTIAKLSSWAGYSRAKLNVATLSGSFFSSWFESYLLSRRESLSMEGKVLEFLRLSKVDKQSKGRNSGVINSN